MPRPASLQLASYPGDSGVYLFHCSADGDELTDTWHESLDDALEQARAEFGVMPAEWVYRS